MKRHRIRLAKQLNQLGARANTLSNTMSQLGASMAGHRYWHDNQGQPRRLPGKRPLLHNGRTPR